MAWNASRKQAKEFNALEQNWLAPDRNGWQAIEFKSMECQRILSYRIQCLELAAGNRRSLLAIQPQALL